MKPSERFDLHESIGRDQLGEVSRATERGSGKRAAVKVFDAWTLGNDEATQRYHDALKALRVIRPARTPPVSQFEFSGPEGWIASRWVEAPNLADYLDEHEALDVDEATAIVCGILDALDELHSAGEAHGGLSPRKVLLLEGASAGGVVVTDPFQHYLYSVADPIKTSRRDPDRFLGLPEYFSPEQARGEAPDVRSDVYVVGLLFYELLTGKTPFGARSVSTTLKRQIYEKPLPARYARPGLDLPEDAETILQTALNKEPEQRFQSALAFRRAVHSLRRAAPDESLERASAPMGIVPAGVLVGKPVPTDAHDAIEAPPEADEPQARVEAQVSEAEASQDADADDAKVDATEPADVASSEKEVTSADDASDEDADGAEDAEEAEGAGDPKASADAPSSEEAQPPGVADDAAAAADEPADTDEETATLAAPTDDDADDEDGDEDDDTDTAASASKSRGGKRKNKKGRKGKKNRKPQPRLDETESPAAVTATAVRASGVEKAAALETSKTAPVDKAARTSSGPIALDDDDELGWFALGDDAEALTEREAVVAEVEDDESGRQNRRFLAGVAAAIVIVVLGVIAFSNAYRGGEDEEGEAAEATEPDEAPVAEAAPEPERAAEPEPEPAAEPEVAAQGTGDAVRAAADEVTTATEEGQAEVEQARQAEPAPEAEAEPAPEAEAEPAPEAEAEPAPEAEAEPAPEAETEPAPDPEPEAAPEPAAAPEPPAATPRRQAAAPAPTPAQREPEPPAVDEGAARRAEAQAMAQRGQQALQRGDWSAAAGHFEDAIALDSNLASAQFGLGEANFQQRNYAQAARYYRAATRMRSGNAEYHNSLGQAYFRMGNLDAALQSFEASAELGDAEGARNAEIVRSRIEARNQP